MKCYTMCRKIGYAANSVTLYFHVGAQHLPDEGLQSTEFDDEKFVVRYENTLSTAKMAWRITQTVNREVA